MVSARKCKKSLMRRAFPLIELERAFRLSVIHMKAQDARVRGRYLFMDKEFLNIVSGSFVR